MGLPYRTEEYKRSVEKAHKEGETIEMSNKYTDGYIICPHSDVLFFWGGTDYRVKITPEIKKAREVVEQAFKDGAEIEMSSKDKNRWIHCHYPVWAWGHIDYRVKWPNFLNKPTPSRLDVDFNPIFDIKSNYKKDGPFEIDRFDFPTKGYLDGERCWFYVDGTLLFNCTDKQSKEKFWLVKNKNPARPQYQLDVEKAYLEGKRIEFQIKCCINWNDCCIYDPNLPYKFEWDRYDFRIHDPYREAKEAFKDGELQFNYGCRDWYDWARVSNEEPLYGYPVQNYRRKPKENKSNMNEIKSNNAENVPNILKSEETKLKGIVLKAVQDFQKNTGLEVSGFCIVNSRDMFDKITFQDVEIRLEDL